MTRIFLHLSAIAKLAFAPFTLLCAACSTIDWGSTFGLPGYQALVPAPIPLRGRVQQP